MNCPACGGEISIVLTNRISRFECGTCGTYSGEQFDICQWIRLHIPNDTSDVYYAVQWSEGLNQTRIWSIEGPHVPYVPLLSGGQKVIATLPILPIDLTWADIEKAMLLS